MNLTHDQKKFLEEVLIPYIRDSLRTGFKKEEIYSVLIENGHEKEIVDFCFDVVEGKKDLWKEEKKEKTLPQERFIQEKESIRSFVQIHLERGFKLSEIENVLLQFGQPKELVEEVISEFKQNLQHLKQEGSGSNHAEQAKKSFDDSEVFKKETPFFDKWVDEQKTLFILNILIWLGLVFLFSISLSIPFAFPAIAFFPLILYPLLDSVLKKKAFFVAGFLSAFLFPILLLPYANPSIEKLIFFNVLFFLLYYDVVYVQTYKLIIKTNNQKAKQQK
ncbi:MAG: hypothetical protein QXD62_01995 [Candidatus Woesearchaeota archaeon]